MKILPLTLLIATFLLTACQEKSNPPPSLQSPAAGSCGSAVLDSGDIFKVEGNTYSLADMPAVIQDEVFKNNFEAYNKNTTLFKEFGLRVHLAKAQNKLKDPKKPPPLIELLNLPEVSEQAAKQFFEANKNRLPPGSTFEKMRPQITQFMKTQGMTRVFRDEVKKMEKSGAFTSLVVAPMAPEVNLDLKGFPSHGNKDAKVQVVEISDYMCGHCQHAHPQVMEIQKKYKDKINFTQINFSLNPVSISGTYIRGAYCAHKQSMDLFWKYHDETFKFTAVPHKHTPGEKNTDGDGTSAESLKKVTDLAQKAGLKMDMFKTCLNSNEASDYIRNTNTMLGKKGINSTPTFFVNKRKIANGVFGLEDAIEKALK